MRTMMTAGVLAATMLAAQVSPDLVKVSREGDKWYIRNLSKQAITGYVFHTGYDALRFSATEINFAPAEREWHPIEPGETAEIPVKPGFTAVDIPAVIFADGSVIGTAQSARGVDAVATIFEQRNGEAQEFLRWLQILDRSDHPQALADLRHEAQLPIKLPTGPSDSGRRGAAIMVTSLLGGIDPRLTDEQVYQQLISKVKEFVTWTQRSRIRRAL
jgi:hypothetical protein